MTGVFVFLYYINMENILKKTTLIEEKITLSLDLLEVAKGYCEKNFDKGKEVVALSSVIDILIDVQKNIADFIDELK